MSLTTKELKARLAAEAETIIEDLLAETSPAEAITLDAIEQGVLGAGKQFQAVLTQALIEAAEAVQRGTSPICPECEGKMRHHGYREKRMVTRTGEVKVRRVYYRCPGCGRGLFPPG